MKKEFYILSLLILIIACTNDEGASPIPKPEDPEEINVNSGGENFTTTDFGENTFGQQGNQLTREESRSFVFGNSLFRRNWVEAPASVTSLDGLGPLFNARSCGGCHFKDGRAAPFDEFAVRKPGTLWRISVNGNQPHPMYGSQIQDVSLQKIKPEGNVETTYETIIGTYTDGTSYELLKPILELKNLGYGTIQERFALSTRIAPHLAGLGLLEAIPQSEIMALEDEFDQNQDGISGKIRIVENKKTKQQTIGRFGWKNEQPTILQQSAIAFSGDMGLTTNLFPNTDFTDEQKKIYPDVLQGGYPEVTDFQLKEMVIYLQALAVPAKRNTTTEQYLKGQKLFRKTRCNSCHVEKFVTKSGNNISSLDNQTISPFTDLLLHDMGEGLADMDAGFNAKFRKEWRTPPLWGIGLIPNVNKHTRLLHDGRARNVEEAILWHGGEAEQTKNQFKQLAKQEREALIFYINNN